MKMIFTIFKKIVFNTGIFLNMFERNPLPLISLTETNFDFIFLQISHLAEIYGLLFLVNLPIESISFVCFLQDRQNIIIYKYIILIHF